MAELVIFYIFAFVMLASAVMVIVSRNPVQGALFLVMAFVAAAGIWMFLQAEFLSLVLILVYVGAVMTLFLFVVMMMNLEHLPSRESFKRYLPLALVIIVLLLIVIITATQAKHLLLGNQPMPHHPADYSNVKALGNVLYTNYVYAFELASVILLASIIAAIALAFRGPQSSTRKQRIDKQVATRREDSVKLVRMKSGGSQP